MRLLLKKKMRVGTFAAGLIAAAWWAMQSGCFVTIAQDQYLVKPKSVEKKVSFETEDGWRIYGTLTLPE